MSDTPRTDERSIDLHNTYTGSTMHMVRSSFARQLERELAAANARIARLEEAGERVAYARDEDDIRAAIQAWEKAKEGTL